MIDDVSAIRRILAEDGRLLKTVFQPIVDVRTGRIVGVEALARFDSDPYRTPDLWFAAAERCGLGLELELFAVRLALTSAHSLPPDTYVALNVAPSTLTSPELRSLLEGRALERVVLELTEHARVESYEPLREAVSFYRGRGARLAIDDAGSGYSSFQHILELRPDIIKLDRSLTSGIDENPVRFALATALVTFAQSLGARVCAEGIESSSELVALQQLGVRYGQGYFLGRPNPLPLAEPPAGHWMVGEPALACASPEVRSARRLASLRSTRLLDSEAEEDFDRLTRLAARVLGVPVSLVSLVDDRRQFFKSRFGVGVRETPLSHSFCAHVVTQRSPLVVGDARLHPLVRDNPVVGELGVVAYAGIPIVTADDQTLGSFCAIDTEPREWTPSEVALLTELASIASALVDLRKEGRSLAKTASLVETLLDASSDAVAIVDIDMRVRRASPRFCELVGCEMQGLVGHGPSAWSHEASRASIVAAFDLLLGGRAAEISEATHHVRSDGGRVTRTVSLRLLRDADGLPESFLVHLTEAAEAPVSQADAA